MAQFAGGAGEETRDGQQSRGWSVRATGHPSTPVAVTAVGPLPLQRVGTVGKLGRNRHARRQELPHPGRSPATSTTWNPDGLRQPRKPRRPRAVRHPHPQGRRDRGAFAGGAESPKYRVDAVVCESTSRLAQAMLESLEVERQLERAEALLVPWNEPLKLDGSRVTQTLQR